MKIIRKLMKGLSLTSALFIFQACYGTPQTGDWGPEDPAPAEEQQDGTEGEASPAAVLDEAGDGAAE